MIRILGFYSDIIYWWARGDGSFIHHPWKPPAISLWTMCWCFWLRLLVQPFQGNLPAFNATWYLVWALTRLSFHNLESPTTSTTERDPFVDGVVLSTCWCPQPPLLLQLSCFHFHWVKKLGLQHQPRMILIQTIRYKDIDQNFDLFPSILNVFIVLGWFFSRRLFFPQ